MTKRRTNPTGRERIDAQRVSVTIDEGAAGEADSFNCVIDLEGLKLPADGRVVVEAFRTNTRQRFEFGTVSSITSPEIRLLDELDRSGAPSFVVKVVDDSDSRLKGASPTITIADYDNESLLPLRKRPLSSGIIWELSYEEGSPVLLVNNDCIGVMEAFKTPIVKSIMIPEWFRQVLKHISTDYDGDDGESDDWRHRWVSFASRVSGVEMPEDEDGRSDWVDKCVERLAKQRNVVGVFNEAVVRLGVDYDQS